jgi:hypothetical protein
MLTHYGRCPFSKSGCKECPIYRGRHCHIKGLHSEEPRPAAEKDGEWMAGFNDFLGEMDEILTKSIDGWPDPDGAER